MAEGYGIIGVWTQHRSPKHINQPTFDSLRRWMRSAEKVTKDIPLEFTIGAIDEADV